MRLNLGKSLLSFMLVTLLASFGFAQTVVTGAVYDADYAPIAGAEAEVSGTGQKVSTDEQGVFTLTVEPGKGMIEVTSDEKGTQNVPYTVAEGETADLGMVILEGGDGVSLESLVVVGRGVIDLEEDRKTPVAVSTISKEEIQTAAVGNVEFPEVMKNTPSVFVSGQSGFGDSRMFLRGFDQSNTAFLLNGQPINGMEDGKMYWSNWQGLTDVANAVQVQRGLGSSKLAISSVGGTINIVTKATDRKQGGFARFLVGNDSYFKETVGYDTGMSKNGWGLSVMFDNWQGFRKSSEGTRGKGQSFFISVGKKLGNHNFNFLVLGSPQWHGQVWSQSEERLKVYRKYNQHWGFDNGEWDSERINFYFKPVANLNWDWKINENNSLSTVLYASWGRGGGTGPRGARTLREPDGTSSGSFTIDGVSFQGQVDYDAIRDYNATIGQGDYSTYSGYIKRASMNMHQWYGGVLNFEHIFSSELKLNLGADIRFYNGEHFRQIANLYGLSGWGGDRPDNTVVSATFDETNVWGTLFNYADDDERIAYNFSETINYQGVFGQMEYATDAFSVFFQGAVSNQYYKGKDDFTGEESDSVNKIGYNLKGGAAYNLDENNIIFANAGFYSRQPYKDNVFDGNATLANPEPDNEEITGLEAGYKYEEGKIRFNANIYRTIWDNRVLTNGDTFLNTTRGGTEEDVQIQRTVKQIHQGVELDFTYRVNSKTEFGIYSHYGVWEYDGAAPYKTWSYDLNRFLSNSEVGNYTDLNGNALSSNQFEGNVDLTGQKVWDSPQFGFGSKLKYEILKGLVAGTNFNFYGRNYKYQDISDIAESGDVINDKLKSFATIDFNMFYTFKFGGQKMMIGGNIKNLLNHAYINYTDAYGVKYGLGRTWNASVKWEF